MGPKQVAVVGVAVVAATATLAGVDGSTSSGFWFRALFVACWLAAGVLIAWRGEPGVANVATIVFLCSFPVAFSGMSAGLPVADQVWRAVGTSSVVVFLYVFPRGQFEPRWTAASCAASVAYLTARAFVPAVASLPIDLVVFPLVIVLPLCLEIVRFRSSSNWLDRRRLQIVGLMSSAALVGQLVLFGLQSAGMLGPIAAAESVVEPMSYALALLLPAGVTLAIAPIGPRARRLADQLANSGDDVTRLLSRLGTLAQSSTSRDLVPVAAEAIRRSLRVPAVSIEMASSDPGSAAPITAGRVGPEVSWPLTYRGVTIGSLRVTPRPGVQLSAGDRQVLHQLSIQLTPLVASVRLADQLDEARTRLISVREEERRRLRADLHDELGATLAGLTLKSGLAATLIDRDPTAARRLLGEIEANLQASVNRVRRLVEGLRPAQLDELGLDAAIKEQAALLAPTGSALRLHVNGHTDPGLPAAVELAAYRIAQEAITNAVRHSGGSRIEVELSINDEQHLLTLSVADDGIGLGDPEALGFGVQSMRQRAQEVGGDCFIRAHPSGGVEVTARLPLLTGGDA